MIVPILWRPALALSALALLGSCSGDDGLTAAESSRVFSTSTGLLHQIHLSEISTTQEVPSNLSATCTGGGTVEMTVLFDGQGNLFGNIVAVEHQFVACQHQGLTLSGPFDYTNIVMYNGGQCFDIDMDGSLEITGEITGSCTIAARETCAGIDGLACGNPI